MSLVENIAILKAEEYPSPSLAMSCGTEPGGEGVMKDSAQLKGLVIATEGLGPWEMNGSIAVVHCPAVGSIFVTKSTSSLGEACSSNFCAWLTRTSTLYFG